MGEEAVRDAGAPREKLTAAQRERAARRLLEAKGRDRHLATRLAEGYEVSARWMRFLRRRLERGETPKPKGRPRIGEAERARVRSLVVDQMTIQGIVGWRDVLAGIRRAEAGCQKPTSTMLVQEATAAVKKDLRVRKRRALEQRREGHEVLCRDAVWAEDALHAGRLASRAEVQAELATDRGSSATVIAAVGPPATGEDLKRHLEQAKAERGGLPLVWQSDRGSANTSAVVRDYLEAELVIHLLSRTHTPTDNPVAENRNREIEEESGLGQGVRLASVAEAAARLLPARRRLDEGRLRGRRGWKTAAELDREMPKADTKVDRKTFYAEARSAMKEVALGLFDPDEIRKAEQDTIWRTLEKHGLATSHVGRRKTPCPTLAPASPPEMG